MRGSLGFLPIEGLLWVTIGPVLLAVWSVVAGVCTPMLFTKRAILLPVTFLGNHFIKGDNLALRGVIRLGSSLMPISNIIGGEGSFHALKGFQ